METRKKPLSAWHYGLGLVIVLALIWLGNSPLVQPPTQAAAPDTVTLRSESWNDGKVLVWHDLDESSDRYTGVRGGTRCTRLDDRVYTVGTGGNALRYYRVRCGDVTGYILTHQAR